MRCVAGEADELFEMDFFILDNFKEIMVHVSICLHRPSQGGEINLPSNFPSLTPKSLMIHFTSSIACALFMIAQMETNIKS